MLSYNSGAVDVPGGGYRLVVRGRTTPPQGQTGAPPSGAVSRPEHPVHVQRIRVPSGSPRGRTAAASPPRRSADPSNVGLTRPIRRTMAVLRSPERARAARINAP
jgi:hypothetical protein